MRLIHRPQRRATTPYRIHGGASTNSPSTPVWRQTTSEASRLLRHWSLLDIRLHVQVRMAASNHGGKAVQSKATHCSFVCPSLMFSCKPTIVDPRAAVPRLCSTTTAQFLPDNLHSRFRPRLMNSTRLLSRLRSQGCSRPRLCARVKHNNRARFHVIIGAFTCSFRRVTNGLHYRRISEKYSGIRLLRI
jgi:hypothetical protein